MNFVILSGGRRTKLVGINNSNDVSIPVFIGSTNNE